MNDPKRTPVDQKIGDFYASCMDEAAIEKLGAAPLKPELDRIDALTSKSGIGILLVAAAPDRRECAVRFLFRRRLEEFNARDCAGWIKAAWDCPTAIII